MMRLSEFTYNSSLRLRDQTGNFAPLSDTCHLPAEGADGNGRTEIWPPIPAPLVDTYAIQRPSGEKAGSTWLRDSRANGSGFPDRKSTRLNSSHLGISYAVFCL